MLLRILFMLIALSSSAYASTFPIHLGDQVVLIQVTEGQGQKAFVHLHQNETTALKAAKHISKEKGAGLLTLKHAGGRNIKFKLHHQQYEFDPNRIFTDQGIKRTLSTYGHYSSGAHQAVKKLAQSIIKYLPKGRLIAVHNNNGYSILDYLPGHPMEHDAKAIYLTQKHFYRNFFLFTQVEDFTRVKNLGLNGILQADNAQDDGSLSVLFKHSSYVNAEAGYNQLNEQIMMLRTV